MAFGATENQRAMIKAGVLLNNIYGVDLDEQAVEIARLNLLINTFNGQIKLPNLTNNIKNGNSLISGTDEELIKYFGKNFRAKRPFNWQDEFPEVFKQGGFDCIVGNPPWGANIDNDAEYLALKFPDSTKAHKDTYKIFVDLALQKLRPEGRLGLVLPNTFLYQPRYQDIKDMLDKHDYTVVNLGEKIFGNVELPCSILVTQNRPGANHVVIDLTRIDRAQLASAIWQTTPKDAAKASAEATKIFKNTGYTFDDVFLLKDGGAKHQRKDIGKSEKGKSDLRERLYYTGKPKNGADRPLLVGADIDRYELINEPSFILRGDYRKILQKNEIVYFD